MKIEFYKYKKFSLNDINEKNTKGSNFAKYAMAVAIAGHHNIIISGANGSGKTLLLQHLQNLLPKLNSNEIKIKENLHKLAYKDKEFYKKTMTDERPFKQPHYTIGIECMIGGGKNLTVGEISLAHNGVLFLDELEEFRSSILQMLIPPMINKKIAFYNKENIKNIYPSNFLLAATMKPCPCGNNTSKTKICLCSVQAEQNYINKLKPILNEIAIKINLNNPIDFPNYTEEELQKKIIKALKTQKKRKQEFLNNDLIATQAFNILVKQTEKAKKLLKKQSKKDNSIYKNQNYIELLARTVADMEEHELIQFEDMQIAIKLNSGLNELFNMYEI